ncbi:glycosyltransferase family 2 protein [Massilia putida]|uniref:glycosyltransferase family 2 protein n=1 Tax=Massilia putida TaxID=1141883 RepID=UPI0009529A62|nr:glycosyltransferase [Massilia putida]
MIDSGLDTDASGHTPKVTVVVPTFRRKDLLKETVDSILAQTYRDFELIIVDNMSEDGTAEYVAGLNDPRVRYYRNPNGGIIAVNRNFGIRQARGEYIALCDDDDVWQPTKLEKQVTLLSNRPAVAMCYCNAAVFTTLSQRATPWMMKRVHTDYYRNLLIGNFIPNSSVLLRRADWDALGGFREERELIAVEDYEMWLRLAREHEIAYIDECLLLYRVHPSAASNSRVKMARKHLNVLIRGLTLKTVSPRYLLAVVRSAVRVVYAGIVLKAI